MHLRSAQLSGCRRLEDVSAGGRVLQLPSTPDDFEAVQRIQRALVTLGHALPRSFPNGPNSEPDGKFGTETRQAVIAFQKRAFPNDPKQWDGRVGPKTLRKMDELLPAAGPDPTPAKLRADLVVRFRGAATAGNLTPDGVLPRSLIAIFNEMPNHTFGPRVLMHPHKSRAVVRVGRQTNTIGLASAGVFASVLAELRLIHERLRADPGRIFIHGSSSGGRNAIDFANHLSTLGLKPHFVAAVDAAFFQADTASRPEANVDQPTTVPLFTPSAGATVNRHNFFQTRGNHAKRSARRGLLFTSSMAGEEIHGTLSGFINLDLTSFLSRELSDDQAHEKCGRRGTDAASRLIADALLLDDQD
ncbi:hypothetical protein F183_A09060 [Bryobacterales bacterium F-183]|nr:hypothetical protein F183_A09060 [Bryobacterales bacterium F-183]